jgi:hypothetical protein
MRMRNQIISCGEVIWDGYFEARTDFSALHTLLKFHGISYDPGNFYRRADWVCFKHYGAVGEIVYRVKNSKEFG